MASLHTTVKTGVESLDVSQGAPNPLYFFLKITLFTYSFIFDCAGSSLLYRFFSSCSEWRATLELQSTDPRVRGLQELQLPESRAQAQ